MILVPGMVENHHDNPENLVSTKEISRNGNGREWQSLPKQLDKPLHYTSRLGPSAQGCALQRKRIVVM